MMMTKACGNRRQGTTLIEVLVVIVVFAVGILAVMQVFPGGLRIMADQRDRSVAQQLAKSSLQLAVGSPEGFPEQILPVAATQGTGVIDLIPNPSQRPDPTSFGVQNVTVDDNGLITKSGNVLGHWELLSGANLFRRIINEGHRIPAPRQVGTNYYGGLLFLNYGPCMTNGVEHASGLTYNPIFDVISADLVQKEGAPDPVITTRDHVYFIDLYDGGDVTLYLPRTAATAGSFRTYEVKISAVVRLQSTQVVREDIAFRAVVDSDPAGGYYAYQLKNEASFLAALNTGDTLLSLDKESVRIARQFTKLANAATFSTTDPYEYKLVNWNLGLVLFNPLGYSVTEERPQGRVPLRARISYDVYDWRILKDEVRVPDYKSEGGKMSLPVRNLRVLGNVGADGKGFPGLNIPIPDYDVVNTTVIDNYLRDFAIIDTETGGAYVPSSYSVDYSRGVVTFNSPNAEVVYPGDSVKTPIVAAGRSVRVLYMAEGDYAVQLQKSSADYKQVYDTPGLGQFFVGGTKPGAPAYGNPNRIYFPWADLGQSVRFDRVAYLVGTTKKSLTGQSLQITTTQADSVGPFIDITSLDDASTGFDLTDGYGVQGVHGASVSARAIWNRGSFGLGPNTTENANALDAFRQTYKNLRLTTSFMGGEAQ